MLVCITKFEKNRSSVGYYAVELQIALHPAIVKGNQAEIFPVGIEPVVTLASGVMEHTQVSQVLRDMADSIDSALEGKTIEDFEAAYKERQEGVDK